MAAESEQTEELSFELFECFLDFLDQGATEEQAWALTAYEQGLLTRKEAFEMFGEPQLTGFRRDNVRVWEIPEDPFDRLVYLTAWNEWIGTVLFKIMHNNVVLKLRERKFTKVFEHKLVYDFPRDISELALQNQLEEILRQGGGYPRACYIQKSRRNRRAIFALQCLLKLPEGKILQLLASDPRPRLVIQNASRRKFRYLKKALLLQGVLISF